VSQNHLSSLVPTRHHRCAHITTTREKVHDRHCNDDSMVMPSLLVVELENNRKENLFCRYLYYHILLSQTCQTQCNCHANSIYNDVYSYHDAIVFFIRMFVTLWPQSKLARVPHNSHTRVHARKPTHPQHTLDSRVPL
jgi:hypothetical protein